MKNWLYETKLLLPFFCVISFFLTMSFALFTSASQAKAPVIPFLSQSGVSFQISNEQGTMKNKDFLLLCSSLPKAVVITRGDSFSKTVELFSSAAVSMGAEKRYDFSTENPVAVLSKDRRQECVEKDGALYFSYGNRSHPVAGWLDGSVQGSGYTCVLGLGSVLAAHPELSFSGTFSLDAGTNTAAVLQELEDACGTFSGVTLTRLGTVNEQRKESLKEDNKLVLGAIGLLTLLLCLNLVRLLDNWLSLKRRECRVRSLLGANEFRLGLALAGSYAPVILCSTVLGAGLAWVVSLFHPFSFVSFHMSLAAVGFSALMMALLGIFTFGVALLLYYRRDGKGAAR